MENFMHCLTLFQIKHCGDWMSNITVIELSCHFYFVLTTTKNVKIMNMDTSRQFSFAYRIVVFAAAEVGRVVVRTLLTCLVAFLGKYE